MKSRLVAYTLVVCTFGRCRVRATESTARPGSAAAGSGRSPISRSGHRRRFSGRVPCRRAASSPADIPPGSRPARPPQPPPPPFRLTPQEDAQVERRAESLGAAQRGHEEVRLQVQTLDLRPGVWRRPDEAHVRRRGHHPVCRAGQGIVQDRAGREERQDGADRGQPRRALDVRRQVDFRI